MGRTLPPRPENPNINLTVYICTKCVTDMKIISIGSSSLENNCYFCRYSSYLLARLSDCRNVKLKTIGIWKVNYQEEFIYVMFAFLRLNQIEDFISILVEATFALSNKNECIYCNKISDYTSQLRDFKIDYILIDNVK